MARARCVTGFALVALLGSVLLSGCPTGVDTQREGFPCNPDGSCRNGLVCRSGTCVLPAHADGGTRDGGTKDGGPTDGGNGCNPACSSGQTCQNGTCVPSGAFTVTITSPADGDVVPAAVTVHSTVAGASGSVTGVSCSTGTSPAVAATHSGGEWTCGLDLSSVGEGQPATITVRATDAASEQATASITVTLDTTDPTVSFTSPTQPDGYMVPAPSMVAVAATATDTNLSEIDLTVTNPDGSAGPTLAACTPTSTPTDSCNGSFDLTGASVAHGLYTITATAIDLAGNTATAAYHLRIDDTPPTVMILNQPNGPVTRDADASFSVAATDAQTSVGSISFAVVDGKGPGQDLPVPVYSTGGGGQKKFVVTGVGGNATPVLNAATGSFTVRATATDVWGNQGSTTAQLTITRVKWVANLSQVAGGGAQLTSPAVGSDGTIYAVVAGGNNGQLVSLDPATGTINMLPAGNRPILGGPVVLVDQTTNQSHVYVLSRSQFTGNTNLESLTPTGQMEWVYPQSALSNPITVAGLPAAGSSGMLVVPISGSSVTGGGRCVDQVAMGGGAQRGEACVAGNQQWQGDARSAVAQQGSQTLAIVCDSAGEYDEFSCSAGTCGVYGANANTGIGPAGEPAASTAAFYLAGNLSGLSGGPQQGAAGWAWNPGLAGGRTLMLSLPAPPSMGVLLYGSEIAGGIADKVWWGRTDVPATPTLMTVPMGGNVVGLSQGTDGDTYALVSTTSGGAVVAFGPQPDHAIAWQYPDTGKALAPPPPPNATAVLGANGVLYVPDASLRVTALVTDSPGPAAGWSNVRGDPGRSGLAN